MNNVLATDIHADRCPRPRKADLLNRRYGGKRTVRGLESSLVEIISRLIEASHF